MSKNKNKDLNALQRELDVRQLEMKQLQERLAQVERDRDELGLGMAERERTVTERERLMKQLQERLTEEEQEQKQLSGRLDDRERAVAERELLAEPGLADRNRAALQEVESREAACRQLEQTLGERKCGLDGQADDLARQEGEVATRLRHLREQELNALAGFADQNRSALAALEKQRDDLLRENQEVTAHLAERRQACQDLEIKQARLADHARAALATELAEIRQAQWQAMEEHLRADTEARRVEQTETLRREREENLRLLGEARVAAEAESRRQNEELDCRRKVLDEERQRLLAEETSLQKQRRALSIQQAVIEQEHQLHEQTVENLKHEAVAETDRQCEHRDQLIAKLRRERDLYWEQLQGFEDLRARLGNREPEEVLALMRSLGEEIVRLKQTIAERPGPEVREELQALRAEQGQWSGDRERLTRELQELRAKRDTWTMGVAERENAHRLREVAEHHVETMQAQVEKLGADVKRLRLLYDTTKDAEDRKAETDKPYLSRIETGQQTPADEQGWLEQIRQGCEKSNLVFHRRLLYAFHTALKTSEWSSLAVLAGVSGTGKSELPKVYSRFGGLNCLPLSVQPNWDSPQSLFGFFNSVDNRFNATPLLQTLTQSQRDPTDKDGLADQLLLVLLDEMNLAHVELYFSDLLSKLEDRRGGRQVHLDIDLGAGLIHRVPLGRNVFWTGTMNEDETTKTLSDKVLDRGNIIVFPRPRELRRRERATLAPAAPMLRRSVWDSWVKSQSVFSEEQVQPFKHVLEDMNGHLERVGRALGHRVWQSVEHYMANHPDVIAAQKADGNDAFRNAMDVAFGDQLVQKVMPKLRGIETSGAAKRDCLDPIRALLIPYGIEKDFDLACTAGYGGFVWRSAHYLEAKS